jgi:hypothetical protein
VRRADRKGIGRVSGRMAWVGRREVLRLVEEERSRCPGEVVVVVGVAEGAWALLAVEGTGGAAGLETDRTARGVAAVGEKPSSCDPLGAGGRDRGPRASLCRPLRPS